MEDLFYNFKIPLMVHFNYLSALTCKENSIMEIGDKELACGFKLPVLGFGTFGIGETGINYNDENYKNDLSIIEGAIDLGFTHIDTAEMYAGGNCEIIVGKAIKHFDRSKLIISTKVSPMNLSYNDVLKSAEDSLKRLETYYIDIYIIHYPNYKISMAETMRAMDYLQEKGLIKYIGVSNFNKQQFIDAQKCCKNKIVLNQVPFSLINRTFQADGSIDHARENDVMIVAWSPVERGVFAGGGIDILDKMCSRYKKTPNQIAINWLISQKNVVTIPASKKIDRLKEYLGALDWSISLKDREMLDLNFPGKEHVSGADKFWKVLID